MGIKVDLTGTGEAASLIERPKQPGTLPCVLDLLVLAKFDFEPPLVWHFDSPLMSSVVVVAWVSLSVSQVSRFRIASLQSFISCEDVFSL